MSEQLLKASIRNTTGKEYCKKIRKNGTIPANLLANGKGQSIEVNLLDFSNMIKKTREFSLDLDGTQQKVKLGEIQIDFLRREPSHVEFVAL